MENRKDTTRNLACLKLPFRPSFVGRPRPSVRPSFRPSVINSIVWFFLPLWERVARARRRICLWRVSD